MVGWPQGSQRLPRSGGRRGQRPGRHWLRRPHCGNLGWPSPRVACTMDLTVLTSTRGTAQSPALVSGNVCMQEFKAPGSGGEPKAWIGRHYLSNSTSENCWLELINDLFNIFNYSHYSHYFPGSFLFISVLEWCSLVIGLTRPWSPSVSTPNSSRLPSFGDRLIYIYIYIYIYIERERERDR